MKKLIVAYILMSSFCAYSQRESQIIKDIFSTQTHDWIDCKISMPYKFRVQKIKHHIQKNRRSQYTYLITPISEKFKKNAVEMYLAEYIKSDSSAITTLASFFNGIVVKDKSSFIGVVNEEFLITYKHFNLGRVTYFFTISTKNKQGKEHFDIDDFKWFTELINSVEYSHITVR